MVDSSLTLQRPPERSDALRFNPSQTVSEHRRPPQKQLSTTTAQHGSARATDRPLFGDPFALIPAATYSALAQLYHLVRLCIGDQSRLARLLSHSRQSGLAPAAGALVGGGYAHAIGTAILQRVLIGSASEMDSINRVTDFRPYDQRRSRSGIGLDGVRTRALEKRKTAALVVYLVWILGCAEYLHARVAHVVAVGIAYSKLLRGGLLHKQALREVVLPFTSPNSYSLIESVRETLKVMGFHLELTRHLLYAKSLSE
ncbi:hypothetical protein CNYM01_05210 [Colletotrichum nymphaeae SA-01]|uniref:Uncharacterized protein n=1 Tax=Colletotrichum nymphaeae SA-01 TaxID=1460502 RepID=A0A135TSX7_9PEZI|nr:hypothetical protein CNYM01_05210 [Colletotrichum nymphaeae SA-01]